ncbi:MAG: hypothetical protein NUV67_00020 [archaeon]|nr:hypothetical protein [archaeon]
MVNANFLPILLISAAILLAGCTTQGQTSDDLSGDTGNNTNDAMDNDSQNGESVQGDAMDKGDAANDDALGDPMEQPNEPSDDGGNIVAQENTIIYTSDGYSPNPLTITVGETVTWVNESDIDMWPASAMHPTHTVYPGSGIEKCGTEEEEGLFDACRNIASGESFTFTFLEEGEWAFHDHLTSGKFGKVIVQSVES